MGTVDGPEGQWTTPRRQPSKDLGFRPGQRFEMQRMTATIEQVTEDGRPLSVSFSFAEDLAQFDWLRWAFKGPRRTTVPALGGELQVSILQRD